MLARNPEREYQSTSIRVPEIAILRPPTTFPETGSLNFLPESKTAVFSKIELSPALRVNHRLEEAKFYTRMEMIRFISDINTYRSQGGSLEEAVAQSEKVFEEHIKSYDAEIIQQNPVLLHLNRFGVWNGGRRMLGNNGRPSVDGVSALERKGAVKRVSKQIEEFLLEADNNSFIILMSPQGVSGYLDQDGQDVPHLNTQTMVFWKDQNGNLRGITLVTDLTIEQSEVVMEDLGAPANFFAKKGPEMDRVVNIVENPAKPSLPQAYKNPFEYVFDVILAIRGTGPIRLKQKKGVELRYIEDIRADIAKFEDLLKVSLTKEKCLAEFRELILNSPELIGNPSFQQAIVAKAEETVLLLADEYLDKKNPPVAQNDRYYQQVNTEDRFARAFAFLETRAGCPSGLSVGSLRGSSLGSGVSSSLEGKGGKCDKCPRTADGHYHCPDCNRTFEDESNRAAGDYTPSCGCGYVFACGSTTQELTKAA